MTPEQIRHHATELILDHAREVWGEAIVDRLTEHGVPATERWTACDAIRDLIRTATITVDWPAEPDTAAGGSNRAAEPSGAGEPHPRTTEPAQAEFEARTVPCPGCLGLQPARVLADEETVSRRLRQFAADHGVSVDAIAGQPTGARQKPRRIADLKRDRDSLHARWTIRKGEAERLRAQVAELEQAERHWQLRAETAEHLLGRLGWQRNLTPGQAIWTPLGDASASDHEIDRRIALCASAAQHATVPLADHPAVEWLAVHLWQTARDGHGSMELHSRLSGWLADRQARGLDTPPETAGGEQQ